MSFEEEWARHEADAATRMQLNRIPVPYGPRTGLSHEESEKQQAVTYIRETLGPNVKKAGAKADGGSQAVAGGTGKNGCLVGELRGWETEKGLDACLVAWDRQLKGLTGRLSHEASALTTTNTLFEGNGTATQSRFQQRGTDGDGRAT